MATELERSIRDALRARAAVVVPRQNSPRARPTRRWLPPALAAAAVLVLVLAISLATALRSHDSSGPAASPAANAVGYRWRLTAIDDQYGQLAVPSSLRATIGFSPHGSLDADDTVNSHFGRYRLTDHGYLPVQVGTTDVGFVGPAKSVRVRVLAAIAAVLDSAHDVSARVSGDALTLRGTGGRVLTLRRDGPESDPATPSPTPSRQTS